MKKIILIALLVIIAFVAYIGFTQPSGSQNTATQSQPTQTTTQTANNTVSYTGEAGKDALTLLKNTASVQQDAAGLVVSINNKKADNAKQEYWAFYVNGKMASVGPAEYVTKDEDKIEWKIEKY